MKKTTLLIILLITCNIVFAQEPVKQPVDTAKVKVELLDAITINNRPVFKEVTYNIDPVVVKVHQDGTKREVVITTVTLTENTNKNKPVQYSDELLDSWIKKEETKSEKKMKSQ